MSGHVPQDIWLPQSSYLATAQTVNLVLETIASAKKNEVVTAELQLHSDQGFQYTSNGYFN